MNESNLCSDAPFDRSPDRPSIPARTVACRLTAEGRSAVAVVAVQGPAASNAMAHCFVAVSDHPWKVGQVRYGDWRRHDDASVPSESVVVTPVAENHFEVHCHGGRAAVTRILADLSRCGVEIIHSRDWSRGSQAVLHREAEEVLIHCKTARTAAYPLSQLGGGLHAWAIQWTRTLIPLAESIPDEAMPKDLAGQLNRQLHTILSHAAFTTRLNQPFEVVFCGAPNVGKSSLVNAIVGYDRCITYDEPGTTRDVLQATTVISGIPMRLLDTAGLRDLEATDHESLGPQSQIEREGMRRAERAIRTADLLVHVVDARQYPESILSATLSPTASETKSVGPPACPTLIVVNKRDLLTADRRRVTVDGDVLFTCAINGDGIDVLCDSVVKALVPRFPDAEQPLAINHRQVAAVEAIRNGATVRKLLEAFSRLLRSESPTT